MTTALLVLPIMLPLAAAALGFLAYRSRTVQRVVAVAGMFAHLAAGIALLAVVDARGIQAVQLGDWQAPFGITLVADLFSAIMVAVAGLMGASTVVYALFSIDRERESFCFYPLLTLLIMGVSGAFLTGDIFNLFVWFEVMLMASFVLMALGGERPQLEGGLKYVTINLVSSALFLSAVGVLYGILGTLNMADLSQKLADPGNMPPRLATTLAMMFLVAFGIKAGLFPLFFWLPASYHTPPISVTAIFAGLLTKVGIYAIIRVFTLLFTQDVDYTHSVILVLAGATMVTGVLGAAAQFEVRRLLSFHIISQIGYIAMGLGLHTKPGLAAAVYFLVHNILAKTNLFLISGVAHRLRGTYHLKKLGGLYKAHPWLSVMFIISAMSLAGIPPLSGFFGKFALVWAGLEIGSYAIVAVALFVSILTLFSMTKIWAAAFWSPAYAPEGEAPAPDLPGSHRDARGMMVPIVVLAALTVALGVGAEYFFGLSMRAAEQLMDPAGYIAAVLGDRS